MEVGWTFIGLTASHRSPYHPSSSSAKSLLPYQNINLGLISQTGFSIIQHQKWHMNPLNPLQIPCKIGHFVSCLTMFQGKTSYYKLTLL